MRFQCQEGCTNCCTQKGFVYLTEEDVLRLASFTGVPAAEFEGRYVYRTRNFRRLRVPRGSTCHFLLENGCAVHPAKPVQCRIFPFWPELMDDRKEWDKTASWCPGIGKGELVRIGNARALAQEMRAAHPAMYP
jgi:uncharacterized protein